MKFSWSYVKQNPWLFGGIFLVFGVGVYLIVNRGGGSGSTSSGSTIISAGPSEAFQAQAMAINAQENSQALAFQIQREENALALEAAAMQIEGQQNIAILQQQLSLTELETNRSISSEQTAASLAALNAQLNSSFAMQESNNRAGVDMARMVQETATQQLAIGAMMQTRMGEQQLEAFKIQTAAARDQALIAQVGTLKRKDRDTALGALIATGAGYGFDGGKGDDRIIIGGGSGAPINYNPIGRATM